MTHETAALICELNPKYDSDSSEQALNERRRERRIASMLRFANSTRAQRRANHIPDPFDDLDRANISRIGE